MRKFFLCFALNISALYGVVSNSVDSLFTTLIPLPENLLDSLHSLEQEIKFTWPNAKYYRETMDFGKVFPALEQGYVIERPIPEFVAKIRSELFARFQAQLEEGLKEEDFDNCIITIYQAGNGIAPHVDRNLAWANEDPRRKYYFDEAIMGLIVEPDLQESLYFENPSMGKKSRFYLEEEPGMGFLFQGPLRNEWKHGLDPVAKKRISMTFRRVIEKNT